MFAFYPKCNVKILNSWSWRETDLIFILKNVLHFKNSSNFYIIEDKLEENKDWKREMS